MKNFENGFIEFQEYMGKLKHLRRTGWVDRKIPNAETVGSHSWRMAMMVLQIEDRLKEQGYDVDKVIEICLLHDVGEAVVGDIVPEEHQQLKVKIPREEKKRMEMEAVSKLSKDYGFPMLLERFNEHETGKTPEAKLVAELDKVDMLLQSYEYSLTNPKIKRLDEFLANNRQCVTLPFLKKIIDEVADRYDGLTPDNDDEINNFVDFQMVCGNLKHLDRAGPKMYNIPDCETVASHSWRSAVMALQMKDKLKEQGIDVNEVVRILLVHDLGEVVTGDIPPEKWQQGEKKITAKEKKKMEVSAVAWMTKEYNVPFLWKGYRDFEKQETATSQFAKDMEIYESIQQAYEYIKDYPEKEILQQYIPYHKPRIRDSGIIKIIDRLDVMQKNFLAKDGVLSFYENAGKRFDETSR